MPTERDRLRAAMAERFKKLNKARAVSPEPSLREYVAEVGYPIASPGAPLSVRQHPITAFYRHLWYHDRNLMLQVLGLAAMHSFDLLSDVPILYVCALLSPPSG